VTERRQSEFDVLMQSGVGRPIWRPVRGVRGEPTSWAADWSGTS
jgi:hypothetical protein